ncbi:hypothetical protein CICLE_v10017333mg [Citrus x clementina]|uniref:Uncharacterized protein n=1 Tax=Citrus clementina TaxID=85681 RepID=V4VZA6_CITCL|nr:hypothetical protein CICLE_v10017333mg [Citrus x clementina]
MTNESNHFRNFFCPYKYPVSALHSLTLAFPLYRIEACSYSASMDGTLRSFLLNYNPEYTFCYPWERCLDPEVSYFASHTYIHILNK